MSQASCRGVGTVASRNLRPTEAGVQGVARLSPLLPDDSGPGRPDPFSQMCPKAVVWCGLSCPSRHWPRTPAPSLMPRGAHTQVRGALRLALQPAACSLTHTTGLVPGMEGAGHSRAVTQEPPRAPWSASFWLISPVGCVPGAWVAVSGPGPPPGEEGQVPLSSWQRRLSCCPGPAGSDQAKSA